MNNRVQQRFDRSIREAVAITNAVRERESAARPKNPPLPAMTPAEKRAAKRPRKGWALSLDPVTGATVWGPKRIQKGRAA